MGTLVGTSSENLGWSGYWTEYSDGDYESVTVPIGTFATAFKLSIQTDETRGQIANGWQETLTTTDTLWLAEGWGVVKSTETVTGSVTRFGVTTPVGSSYTYQLTNYSERG